MISVTESLFSLQILDLSNNLMNGSVPISLIRCKRLKALVLSDNNFSWALPFGHGTGLSALEMFDVLCNRLSGSVPSDVGKLSSLQGTADLSHNFFFWLGSGKHWEFAGEGVYNNLTGPIPQNGALVNRGPSGFIGNLCLCGPPMKNPCPLSPGFNQNPNAIIRKKERKGVKSRVVTALIVSDLFCRSGVLFVV